MTALAIVLAGLVAGALAMLLVEQSRTRQAVASERITETKNEQLEAANAALKDENEALRVANVTLTKERDAALAGQRRAREALDLERAQRAETYDANAKASAPGGGAAVAAALGRLSKADGHD